MKLSENDVTFEFMRSGGPGGQHVNRRSTAVRLRVSLEDLPIQFSQKKDLRQHLPARLLTNDDEIIVENRESRSRQRNKEQALNTAAQEIDNALVRARQSRRSKKRKQRVQSGGGGGGQQEDIIEKQKKRRRAETTDDLLKQAYLEDPNLLEEDE